MNFNNDKEIENFNVHLAAFIRHHRTRQQVEQKKLSQKCGLGRDYIFRLESTYTHKHYIQAIFKIFKELKVTFFQFEKFIQSKK